jgi:uncharacterized coiled-coil protein SlyX
MMDIKKLDGVISESILAKIKNIINENEELKERIEELESEVSYEKGKVEELHSDVSYEEGKVEELESEVECNVSTIKELKEEVSCKDFTIEELVLYREDIEAKTKTISSILSDYTDNIRDDNNNLIRVIDAVYEITRHYRDLVKSQEWVILEDLKVSNPPSDLSEYGYYVHNEKYVYKDTEFMVHPGEDEEPWDVFEREEKSFKKIGRLRYENGNITII